MSTNQNTTGILRPELHVYYYYYYLLLIPSLCAHALSPIVGGIGGGKKDDGIISHRRRRLFPHDFVISTHLYMNIEQQPRPLSSSPIITEQLSSSTMLSSLPEFEVMVADEAEAFEEESPPTTETQFKQTNAGIDSPRPKIVIFGAYGKTGRRILTKLLNSGANVDIVAFIRDPLKFEQVLYNNEDLVLGNLINNDDGKRISDDDDDDGGGQRSRNGGPKLRVVVGDVVSSRRNISRSA